MIAASSVAFQKAQAYVNRLIAAGVTVSAAQRAAVTALASAINSIGVSKFSAVYPFIGESATPHTFDLMGSYDITWVGGVTHGSTGITGNGSSGYGRTGLLPSSLSTTSAHLAAYMNGTPAGGASQNYIAAMTGVGVNLFGIGWFTVGTIEAAGLGVATSAEYCPPSANTNHTGLLAASVNGSRNQQYYRNGATVGSTAAATGTLAGFELYLLAGNSAGSPIVYSNMNMRFASIGAGLSASEMSTLYTAVQAFQTALGRQV